MRAPLTEEQRRRIIEELAQREKFSRKNIMRRHGVSRKTLDRLREMALDAATAPSAK
jgi:DeoR/GlpR family transcriptional regulator of sugar metabolism